MQTSGQSNPGLTSPNSPGSATLYAQFTAPVNMGQICATMPLPSCGYTSPQPSSPATVCSVTINSANVTTNQVSTTLSPSTQSGSFSLWEDTGSSKNYIQNGINRQGGAYTDGFNLTTSMGVGQYNTIYATWTGCGNTITKSYTYRFYNYGNTHHSQYTLISEGTCSSTQAKAYIITNLAACFTSGLQTTTMSSQFMSQAALNGSGSSSHWGLLKALAATSCANKLQGEPADANPQNTFVEVPSITGSCNQSLSDSTVAAATSNYTCGQNIFISGYGSPGTVKAIEDKCARCANDPPHFDNWTNSGGASCGLSVGDLPPTGYFVTEQVQQ